MIVTFPALLPVLVEPTFLHDGGNLVRHFNECVLCVERVVVLSRLHARFALEKKFREIAADEGISGSCACDSVTGALKKLQKIFAQNGWLEKEV